VHAIVLVESDAGCGPALARLVRRGGDRVHLVRTPGAAVAAVQRESYDLAVVGPLRYSPSFLIQR
jgi:DNA-binding response OmpR family regulator